MPIVDTALIRRALTRPRLLGGPARSPGVTLPVELPAHTAGPAAVLCAVFDDRPSVGRAPQAHVVLTRRSDRLRSHTGEVSFPGGRLDPGEDALAAALREADEEIGLDPASVDVVGQLSPLSSFSSMVAITPFVGILPGPPSLHPSPAEVERVLLPPVDELCSPGVYHEEQWPRAGGWHPVHFFDLVGDTVWGATARILRELLDVVWAAARP